MVDQLFLLKVLLSFIIGGIWIGAVTFIAERKGSKIGGFLGGLPSTIFISYLFIGIVESPEFAAEATTIFPLAEAITGLFVVMFAVMAGYGFIAAMTSSLFVWLSLTSVILWLNIDNYAISFFSFFIIVIASSILLEKVLHIRTSDRIKINYTFSQTLMRVVLAGSIVALAVLMSKIGGPIYGGVFSAFPAVFFSTLYVCYKSGGMEFARSMTKPLYISGMINVVVYSVGVRYFYPPLGLVWGTLAAYALSLVSAYVSYVVIQRTK